MKAFKQYLITKGYSITTIQRTLNNLNLFKCWMEKEELEDTAITYNDVIAYLEHLNKQGLKQVTKQKYLNTVAFYFSYLQEELQVVTTNPILQLKLQGVDRRKLYDLFTEQELDVIYQNYEKGSVVRIRNKIILGLIIYQSLDKNILSKLKVEDVKLREGKVIIHSSRRSNHRVLVLRGFQIIDLQEYILQTRNELCFNGESPSDKLILSQGSSSSIHNVMASLTNQLKQQDNRIKSLKQLRASVITHWLKSYSLRKVQYMAGHKYISSTEAYQVGNIEELQNDIERFHPLG